MINLQEYLYKKIKNILDSWDLSDSYSVSFFIYSNECNEYKDYSNISKNDETFFKENYSGEDEGLYSEDRWNYAFLEMDEYDILDEETMEILFDWYKQEGIENIGYEDHDCYA